jgi:transposase
VIPAEADHRFRSKPIAERTDQFCARYLEWARPLSATMRQAHPAGERAFIDFSGSGLDIADPLTGECQKAVLFRG